MERRHYLRGNGSDHFVYRDNYIRNYEFDPNEKPEQLIGISVKNGSLTFEGEGKLTIESWVAVSLTGEHDITFASGEVSAVSVNGGSTAIYNTDGNVIINGGNVSASGMVRLILGTVDIEGGRFEVDVTNYENVTCAITYGGIRFANYWKVTDPKNAVVKDNTVYESDGRTPAKKVIIKESHDLTMTEKVEPTCTEAGTEAYWTCGTCKKMFSDAAGETEITEPVQIPALGHDWNDPTYAWADDNSTCTATRVCGRDANHVESETVNTTSQETKAATCTENGNETYTAAFENEAFAVQTRDVTIPATGHDWGEWQVTKEATATEKGEETRVCKNDPSHTETREIPMLNTYTVTFKDGETTLSAATVNDGDKVTKPADPTKEGYTFDGWYADTAFSVAFDFETAITADTTVYAKFTEEDITPPAPAATTYTVTFRDGETTLSTATVNDGDKVAKPDDPTKEGYTFDGWYADAAFTAAFDFDTAITEDTTVYARFTENSIAPPATNTDSGNTGAGTAPKTDSGNTGTVASAKTGDSSQPVLWAVLLIAAAAAVVVLLKRRKTE